MTTPSSALSRLAAVSMFGLLEASGELADVRFGLGIKSGLAFSGVLDAELRGRRGGLVRLLSS